MGNGVGMGREMAGRGVGVLKWGTARSLGGCEKGNVLGKGKYVNEWQVKGVEAGALGFHDPALGGMGCAALGGAQGAHKMWDSETSRVLGRVGWGVLRGWGGSTSAVGFV